MEAGESVGLRNLCRRPRRQLPGAQYSMYCCHMHVYKYVRTHHMCTCTRTLIRSGETSRTIMYVGNLMFSNQRSHASCMRKYAVCLLEAGDMHIAGTQYACVEARNVLT
jgi:hypothetical protein